MTDAYSLSECVFPHDILVLVGKALADAFAIPGPGAVRRESPRACNVYFLQVSKALTRLLDHRMDEVWARTCRVPLPWTSMYRHTMFYMSLAAAEVGAREDKMIRLGPDSWKDEAPLHHHPGMEALATAPHLWCSMNRFNTLPDTSPHDGPLYVDLGHILRSMLGPENVDIRRPRGHGPDVVGMDMAASDTLPVADTLPIIIAQGHARTWWSAYPFIGLFVPEPGDIQLLGEDGHVGYMTMAADMFAGVVPAPPDQSLVPDLDELDLSSSDEDGS